MTTGRPRQEQEPASAPGTFDFVLGEEPPPVPKRAVPANAPDDGSEYVDSIENGTAVLIRATPDGDYTTRTVNEKQLPRGTKEGTTVKLSDGLYADQPSDGDVVNSIYAMPRMR